MEQELDSFINAKILITGGGGYLGSKLAEKLVQQVAELFLLDIRFNKISEKLFRENINVHKIVLNLGNKKELQRFCQKTNPDYVFHFGALLNRSRDFTVYNNLYRVNVEGTLNILEALKVISYKCFVFSSSSEVYGITNNSPFSEEQLPLPASPYSLTKLMAEDLIKTYSQLYTKPFTILRLFNFFGEDMPEDFFINQLILTLKKNSIFKMTGGDQVRDFLHVNDLLTTMLTILKSGKSNGETINICSGNGIMLKTLANNIAQNLNKEHLLKIGVLPYRENEVWNMVGLNKKMIDLCPDFENSFLKINWGNLVI